MNWTETTNSVHVRYQTTIRVLSLLIWLRAQALPQSDRQLYLQSSSDIHIFDFLSYYSSINTNNNKIQSNTLSMCHLYNKTSVTRI